MYKIKICKLAIVYLTPQIIESFTCIQPYMNQLSNEIFTAFKMHKKIVTEPSGNKTAVLGIGFLHKDFLNLSCMNLRTL